MLLAKHTPGKPLTAAEHQQRRDAARRRWATVAGGGAAGALIGGHVGLVRETVGRQARHEARLLSSAANLEAEIDRGVERERAEANRYRAAYERAFRARMGSGTAPPRDLTQTIESLRNPTAAPLNPFASLPAPVPTGTVRRKGRRGVKRPPVDKRIYDYRIRKLQLQLRRENRWLARLNDQLSANQPRIESDDPHDMIRQMLQSNFETETPAIVRQRGIINEIRERITVQEQLRDAAPRITARRTSDRARGTIESKFVGGETNEAIERATTQEQAELLAQRAETLENIGHAEEAGIRDTKATIRRANLQALRDAMARDVFSKQIYRRIGQHSVIGAGIGFSLAGLGILAHHVLSAKKRQRQVQKIEIFNELAKAQRDTDATAARIARVYRQWIDRLLGRTETPMQMGDDLTAAIAPGITQAFADGYTTPPIDPTSDKRYRIDVDFDVINPAVRRHMAEYALDRIVDITATQRETIRNALMNQSVLQGIGPLDVARTIRQSIGLTMYQEAQVQSFRSQLQALDPRALNRNLRDKRFDPTLKRAIDTGTPLSTDQLDAMTDAYHRRALALRAETIARTESIRATTYGGLARAQEVLNDHPELDVIKIWHSTHDPRTRDTHVNLDNKQVQGMLTNFVTSKNNLIRWPFDEQAPAEEVINCRCYLEYRFVPRSGQLVAVAA